VPSLHPSLDAVSDIKLPTGVQAKNADLKQQLEAAGAIEIDLKAQLDVSLCFQQRQHSQCLNTTSWVRHHAPTCQMLPLLYNI
jgi:hypothetical protein